MLQVFEAESPKAKEAAARFQGLDVYYRPEYLKLSELAGEGKGRFAFYEGAKGRVLYPFLFREAPFSAGGKRYGDIVSPYGYGGPFYEPRSPQLAKEFARAFHAYCLKNGIVAEFIRFFHPVLANHKLFIPADALVPRGSMVVWELDKPEETLKEELSPKVKRNLKTAERAGVTILFDENLERLQDFIRLYEDTMKRRVAEQRYLFNQDYFAFLKTALKPFAFLAFAEKDERIIASSLFLASGPFLAYHLSGSDFEFRSSCANELLLFKAALWGKARGFRFLNLGGGVGGAQDSLFRFKASFASTTRPAFQGKVVHDAEAYVAIVRAWKEASGKTEAETSFFPVYRA